MKAVVAAFNQEKALVGAFSVITYLRMDLFEALVTFPLQPGPHLFSGSISYVITLEVTAGLSSVGLGDLNIGMKMVMMMSL